MYSSVPVINVKVFSVMPDRFRDVPDRRQSGSTRFRGRQTNTFLEGPSFDREGNLYVVDVPNGRVFRIDQKGDWDLAIEYDGEPDGLKIHKDGRIFIADYKRGIMIFDPKKEAIEPLLEWRHSERLRGVNDLVFSSTGDIYFTDQGLSSLADPTGRVYRYTAAGNLECLLYNVPSPNGIALSPGDTMLYVAVTTNACVWRMPPVFDGSAKVRLHTRMTCGGADGMAVDEDGNLVVVNVEIGIVWLFDRRGVPIYRIEAGSNFVTNVAYGGEDRKTLYITDADKGQVLTAEMPVAGRIMYSHM